jgi:hypothetical protein
MKVYLKYLGYHPQQSKPYVYSVLAEIGKTDYFDEDGYIPEGQRDGVEVPDELFGEGSGWAEIKCDYCGKIWSDRTWPGAIIHCPYCGEEDLIPEDAVLAEDAPSVDIC